MAKPLHLAALVLVLAAQTADQSCQAQGDSGSLTGVCDVDTRGVLVSPDGRYVTDVITAKCTRRVEAHKLEAWLQYSTSMWGGWTMPRFPASSTTIPDAEGVPLRVTLSCKEGYYRAAWRTTGRGPALPDYPAGIPFDKRDADAGGTFVDASQCQP